MSGRVIVSRHRATIGWIARQLETEGVESSVWIDGETPSVVLRMPQDVEIIPVITGDATPADVAGKAVYGNLPYHLACHATEVRPVQFRGQLPRGADYTVEQMEAAGVYLGRYRVVDLDGRATGDGPGVEPRDVALKAV